MDYNQQVENSKKTKATIIKSKVNSSEEERTYSRGSGSSRTTYTKTVSVNQPIIKYEYTVEGQKYTSQSLFPGPDVTKDSQDWAQKYVDKFQKGETVQAHYVSSNPSTSYLEKKSSTTFVMLAGIGGFLILLSGLMAWKVVSA